MLAFEDPGFEPALRAAGGEHANRFSYFNQQQAIVRDHHGDADIVAKREKALPFVAGDCVHGSEDASDSFFCANGKYFARQGGGPCRILRNALAI